MLKCDNKNTILNANTQHCILQAIYYQKFNCYKIFKHYRILAFYH